MNDVPNWIFQKKGLILLSTDGNDEDYLLELTMDAGADDLKQEGDHFEITTSIENFESVRKSLEDQSIKLEVAELTRIPQNTVHVTDEREGKSLFRLMESLEDHEDVEKAFSNFDIAEDLLATLVTH